VVYGNTIQACYAKTAYDANCVYIITSNGALH